MTVCANKLNSYLGWPLWPDKKNDSFWKLDHLILWGFVSVLTLRWFWACKTAGRLHCIVVSQLSLLHNSFPSERKHEHHHQSAYSKRTHACHYLDNQSSHVSQSLQSENTHPIRDMCIARRVCALRSRDERSRDEIWRNNAVSIDLSIKSCRVNKASEAHVMTLLNHISYFNENLRDPIWLCKALRTM